MFITQSPIIFSEAQISLFVFPISLRHTLEGSIQNVKSHARMPAWDLHVKEGFSGRADGQSVASCRTVFTGVAWGGWANGKLKMENGCAGEGR